MSNIKITDLRDFVAKSDWDETKDFYSGAIMGVNYGIQKHNSEPISQFKLEFEKPEDKIKYKKVSCGCTTPTIEDVGEHTQILSVHYNTKILGKFSKQITLHPKDKKRKQLIKLTGEIKP